MTRPSEDAPLRSSSPRGPETSEPSGERQVPFFCPYCGEEDLVPAGERPGDWSCRSCARGFSLRFAGLDRPLTEDPE